jgi:hypothetical protein
MFGSKPTCPLDPPTQEWIDRRWQWLTEEFGSERLQSAPVILPTPEFFPDAYSGSEETFGRCSIAFATIWISSRTRSS